MSQPGRASSPRESGGGRVRRRGGRNGGHGQGRGNDQGGEDDRPKLDVNQPTRLPPYIPAVALIATVLAQWITH